MEAHGADHKAWARTFKLLMLLQPSSAAAERVFSLQETHSVNSRRGY